MRKSVIAAWAVLCSLAAAVPASADSPVSLPPLAPGEVLLEVNAVGVVRTPATSAVVTANVSAMGTTEEEARRSAQATAARVAAAARAAGVAPGDIAAGEISVDQTLSTDIYAMNASYEANLAEAAPETHYASAAVVITVRSAAAVTVPALVRTLSAIEHVEAGSPQYRLDDDRAARREARARAVQNARADAESYASSMGMRIVRVLRATERTGLDAMPMMLTENNALGRFIQEGPGGSNRDAQIETYAILGVDYALAPAR
jgi:uncharacterized protein